jgi:hypothetical protein
MGRVVRRISKSELVRGYVEFMYDKLLEWLEDEELVYDDVEEMVDHAYDFIYEKSLEAPEPDIPCDGGTLSIAMFLDYVFKGKLWSDSDIADDLLGWVFEPEDLQDCIEVVNCFDELTRFRNALKRSIKVKIKVGGVESEEG